MSICGSRAKMPNLLLFSQSVRLAHGYPGGCPGLNMPFRKGMDNPLRFTIFWTILGTLGFGAPFLVLRHQLLRNVSVPPADSQGE